MDISHDFAKKTDSFNIVITGLSEKLNNLGEVVNKLCAHFELDVTTGDIKTIYFKSKYLFQSCQ